MAKAATVTSPRFFVAIKGHRITGLVEGEGKDEIRHTRRPVVPHWRPVEVPGQSARGDAPWLQGVELENELANRGITEVPEHWVRRNRPIRSGLRATLFDGCVIEANSVHDARAAFQEQFGINTVDPRNFLDDMGADRCFQVQAKTRLGLVNRDEIKPIGK